MNRRKLLQTGLAAGIVSTTEAATAEAAHIYELRTYELRNDLQPARIQEFFQNQMLPALKRAGAGPVGGFNVISGLQGPALLVLIDYPSLAEMQGVTDRLAADKELTRARQTFETAGELPYVRYDAALFRAFEGHPKLEVPPTDEKRAPRVFELRRYESRTSVTLRNKIEMFNQEEIRIFRDCGFAPVFFGEAIAGQRLPHLTYLVGFDNMAAREKAWDAFRVNPDWARVRTKPGWTDPEAVSAITAAFLRPTAWSQIR
ncbi:MAG: NIPSNAP family protein [Blastocatellia bacterium]|nr:NIPSNAP family protein [Blastocatellia bacterium]